MGHDIPVFDVLSEQPLHAELEAAPTRRRGYVQPRITRAPGLPLSSGRRSATGGPAAANRGVAGALAWAWRLNRSLEAEPPFTTARLYARGVLALVCSLAAESVAANAELASHPYVREEAVKTHVSNVLITLGLRTRVQAVGCADDPGLVHPGGAQVE